MKIRNRRKEKVGKRANRMVSIIFCPKPVSEKETVRKSEGIQQKNVFPLVEHRRVEEDDREFSAAGPGSFEYWPGPATEKLREF